MGPGADAALEMVIPVKMRTVRSRPLTTQQKAELAALAKLPDAEINTRDIPEVRDWSGARPDVDALLNQRLSAIVCES
jgi:hypothetical protein